MPLSTVPAAAQGLPFEPAYAPPDAGRAYLLLQDIAERLRIDGSTATFELTPALAAELAAFAAEGG